MTKERNASSVSVGLIRILKSYACGLGVDFDAIAGGVGLDVSIFEASEARVSAAYFQSLWQKIVTLGKDPYPGLHFGTEIAKHYPGGNVLFTMMMNCANVGQALDNFVRYHRIVADAILPQLIKEGDRVRLSWNILDPRFEPQPELSEALLCTYSMILHDLTQGRVVPSGVYFTHGAPKNQKEYRRVFQSPLIFEAERNELLLGSDALEVPILSANSDLFKVLEQYANKLATDMGHQKVWSDKVLRLISEMLATGIQPDMDSVSKKISISRRTLQEKLKEEGNNFRNCLEIVRRQIALEYLSKPDVTICDITFLLGYSEQSAFNHAFKRWTGKSPGQYRQKLRADCRLS